MTTVSSLSEARPGDWVKGEYEGHPFEGELWRDIDNYARVGGTFLVSLHVRLLHIERPTPPLPTNPGSVIMGVVTVNGTYYSALVLTNSGWTSTTTGDRFASSDIRDFRLGKIVLA